MKKNLLLYIVVIVLSKIAFSQENAVDFGKPVYYIPQINSGSTQTGAPLLIPTNNIPSTVNYSNGASNEENAITPAFDPKTTTHPEFGMFKSPSGGDELIQLRDEYSKLFVNGDGSYSKQTGLLPIHYKDELGNWKTYVNEVEYTENKKFGVIKTDLPITVDAVTGKTTMQLDRKGNSITYGCQTSMSITNAGGEIINSVTMGELYTTAKDSNLLTIPSAWSGIDRRQNLNIYSVETDYILHQQPTGLAPGGELLFTDKVTLPTGWTLVKGEGISTHTGWKGELLILNEKQETKGKFELPYYYDSSTNRDSLQHWTEGEYRYNEIPGGIELTLAVKAEWLLDPERVYPVIIDPTASNSLPQYGNVRGDSGFASSCQQQMNVNVPANSYVTNVNSQYYINARNGAWRNEQRSRTLGPTGTSATYQGCCSSGGGQFYNYNAANIATGYYSGNILFTWQAYGTWPGSSNANCNTTYHYRYNNWVVTVTYTSPCYNPIDDRTITANGSGGPITVCQGSTLSIASSGGNTSNWCYWISSNGGASWNVLAGGLCNQASFNYTVNAAGTWLFHIRNSDACGYCWDIGRSCESCGTCIVTVNVNSPPTAPTSISGTNSICSGQSTTLTAAGGSNGSGATYQWYAGGCGSGGVLGTGVSLSVSPTSTTTYYVRRVGNSPCNGTVTTCASVTVTVSTPPTAPTSITGTASICNGQSTTLTAAGGSNGSGATYQWYAGGCGSGGVLGTGVSLTVSPTSNTTYYVRRVGSTPCNGTVTACASQTVTVTPAPTVNAGADRAQCGTTAWTLTGTSATNYSSINWTYVVNSGTATVTNTGTLTPTITPTSANGQVTMTLNVTANSPCANISDVMVFTWASTPSANAGPDQNNCGGANFLFTGASASTPSTWTWTLLGGGSGTGNLINGGGTITAWGFDPTSATGSRTIRLSVTGTGGCGTTTVTNDIVVSWSQTPVVTTPSDQNNCNNGGVAFTITGATSSGTYSGLSWSASSVSGTGSITAGGTTLTPTFDPSSSSGNYNLTLTATGSSYCTGTNPTATVNVEWVPIPTATSGTATTTCGTDPHPMTGASASGTYSSVAWTGGVGNGTWSNTSTTNPELWTFTPNAGYSGSFTATLTVTGSGFCAGTNPTATRTITITAPPTANAGSDIISCNGSSPISMTGASATNFNTYAWSGGASEGSWNQGSSITNAQFIPSVSGGQFTATLLVTRTTGACAGRTATDSRDLLFVSAPTINSVEVTDVTDCNTFNGYIFIDADGYEPLEYSINNGSTYQPDNFFESLSPGNYTIRVRDAAGCVTTYSSNPVVINPLATVTATVTVSSNVTCGGGNNGVITISAIGGGSPDYEYSISPTGTPPERWDPVTAPPTQTINGLVAGTYDIVVRDRFGCETAIITRTVTQPTPLTISNITVTDIGTCGGSGSGAITVTATGGTGAKTFYRNGGSPITDGTSPFTATWNGLTAGSYSIEVRDANSCSQFADAQINAPWVPNAGDDIEICAGSSVQLQGAYIGDFPTNCAAVCVSNCGMPGGYCASSSSSSVNEWISQINLTGATSIANGSSNSSYTNWSGTSAILAYRGQNLATTVKVTKIWSNPNLNECVRVFIDWNRNGVFEAGEYYSLGCSTTQNWSISQNITVPAGASLGRTRMRIIASYNGYINTTGCGTFARGEVEDYSVDIAAAPVACSQTVTWNTGQTGYTPTVTPASTTTYTMTINDNTNGGSGCIQSSSVTVRVSNQANPTTASVSNVNCNGANDGCATINATGGIAPYLLKKGTVFQPYGGNMKPLTISNSNGTLTNMEVKASIVFTAPMRSDFGDLRFFDANLNKLSHWFESFTLSGAAVVWIKIPSLPNGSSTIYMTYGNNTLTTSSNGDQVFDFFDDFNYYNTSKWTRGTIAGTTGTDWSNYGGVLRGANTNRYQQSVQTFTGSYISETRIFESAAAANGFTTAGWFGTSSNGLSILSHTGTMFERNDGNWPSPGAFVSLNNWVRDYVRATGDPSVCTRTRESGGTLSSGNLANSGLSVERLRIGSRGDNSTTNQNFAAQWDWMFVRTYAATEPTVTVGSAVTSDNVFCGLAPGAHTVNVVDAAGCARTVNFNITQPTALTVSATFTPITCYAPLTGSIDLTPGGGTPSYSYAWAGPSGFSSSTQDPTVTVPGTYNITVTDQNTCTSTNSVNVTQYTPIESPFHTWKGTTNNLWQVPGNWDCGIVPNSTSRVIIPAAPVGGNLPDINAGINANVYDIEIRGNTVNLFELVGTGNIQIHKP